MLLARAVGAAMLIQMAAAQAASVSDISSERSTLRPIVDKESAGGVMGFNIRSVAPYSDLADSPLSVQYDIANRLGFDWAPKHEKRKGVGKHEKTNMHKTQHGGDEKYFFPDRGDDFSFHEKIWSGRKCDTAPVPIPSAAWLLGSGLIGLFATTWRKPRVVGR